MRRQWLALAASSLVCALTACTSSSSSSSGSSGGCKAYDPGAIDLQNPKVSFKKDVVAGVFNGSCGFSSCHGSATSPQGGLFLGTQSAQGSDSSTVQKKIVGVPSQELPEMPFITANDPQKSYLMHKMDGDICQFQCPGGCFDTMPQGSDLLTTDRRDVVRRWIAQGAQDN